MKKNIVIALLLIIIILMGGTFYYLYTNQDKIFDKCPVENSKENEINENIVEKENVKKNSIDRKRYIQNIELNKGLAYGSILISKEGDSYVNFSNPVRDNDVATLEALNNLKKEYKNYDIDGYHEQATEQGETKSYYGLKLPVRNVVAAYEGYTGNGGLEGHYVYLLKEDGTISGFSIGDIFKKNNGKIEIKENINNLKNIVSIVQSATTTGRSEANEVLAVDANGNEYIIDILEY